MKPNRVIGGLCAASGTIVMAGNWLWLVGLAAKPPNDLLDARWGYAAVAYLMAFLFISVGEL